LSSTGSSLVTAALTYDSGTAAADTSAACNGNVVSIAPAAATGQYLQVDVTSPSAGLIDIGLLVAGPLWRINRAVAYGMPTEAEWADLARAVLRDNAAFGAVSAETVRRIEALLARTRAEAIRIHPGNTAHDTDGCLLPGATRSNNSVGQSRMAFEPLFAKIEAALKIGECWIDILDA
jgi:hypothetical protein